MAHTGSSFSCRASSAQDAVPLFIVEAQKERDGIHPWLVAPVIPLLRLLPLLLPLLLLLPLPATGYRLCWNRLSVPQEPHEPLTMS
jgi:hypothetical protein